MRRYIRWISCAALFAILGTPVTAAEKAESLETFTFGTLSPINEQAARRQAYQWLQKSDNMTDTARAAFNKLWAEKDLTVLDRITGTFELADADAAKLLKLARDRQAAAPTTVPKVFSDTTKSEFFRANLALAYAKALSTRKVYEESLNVLKQFKVEQVSDPASFLFHKAVAEHAMLEKDAAMQTIARLLDDVPAAPERYKMVATLMFFDIAQWKKKDLEAISRKMKNIERRLDLERGGKETQKQQKEVVLRLDELIKELENQSKSGGTCSGGNCPGGSQGQPGNGTPGSNIQASSPQQDSNGGNGSGPGKVDRRKIEEIAKAWGKLPPKEQARRTKELLQGYPPEYRKILEEYFRRQRNKEADEKAASR